MKVTCDVVKDLIILNETDSVSDDSNAIIKEHINSCEECRKCQESLSKSYKTKIEAEIDEQALEEKNVIKKVYNKLKLKQLIITIICLIIITPIAFFIFRLAKNQYLGYGLSFSNYNSVNKCMDFMSYIENEQYEKAAKMIDFSEEYNYIMSKKGFLEYSEEVKERYSEVFEMTYEEFESYMIEETIDELKAFSEDNKIKDIKYFDHLQGHYFVKYHVFNNSSNRYNGSSRALINFNLHMSKKNSLFSTGIVLEEHNNKINLVDYDMSIFNDSDDDSYKKIIYLFHYKDYLEFEEE